jgi:tetrapyrrole methylase family protein/MazG family protein
MAQSHQSLRQYLIEEAYEVLDVIDEIPNADALKNERVKGAFREELGDLLMQVLLHSEITQEAGAFDIYDVAATLDEKLIRRHPHVFGDVKIDSADGVLQNWEKLKAKEKASKPDASVLDGLPKGLPALQRAARVLEKVTKVGFQWDDMNGPLEKVDEELAEFKAEVVKLDRDRDNEALRSKVEGELGDLFFTLANVAYLMKISPEDALRSTLHRFEGRFKHVENRLREQGRTPEQSNLEEMDRYWDEAKAREREGR